MPDAVAIQRIRRVGEPEPEIPVFRVGQALIEWGAHALERAPAQDHP